METHYDQSGKRLRTATLASATLALLLTWLGSTSSLIGPYSMLAGMVLLSATVKFGLQWQNLMRGKAGEDAVANALAKLPENYVVERNLVLPGTKIGDLDIVVHGPHGALVIEVKNWRGTVKCEKDRWWIRRENGSWRPVKSPSLQAKRAAAALARMRGRSSVVKCVVAFDERTHLTVSDPTVHVVTYPQLVQYVKCLPRADSPG